MNPHQFISASVTPVVLISACGLIILALYNRLSAILGRIRAFHQQKIELFESRGRKSTRDSHVLLELINSQIVKVTVKAKMIQKGLFCLLAACLAFLSCSFFSGVSAFHEDLAIVAVIAHLFGLILFACGLGWAIRELVHSLAPLEEESEYLRSWTARTDVAVIPGHDADQTRAA